MSRIGTRQVGAPRRLLSVGALAMVVVVTATGCSQFPLFKRRDAHMARRDLIGLSRGEVLYCAGQPDQVYVEGAREYLTYIGKTPEEIEIEADAAALAEAEAEAAERGEELPPEFYEELEQKTAKRPKDRDVCVATFVLRHQLVERLDYSSVAGRIVAKMERCYDVVEDCLTLM